MGAVHRVARLETDDAAPATPQEPGSQLLRRHTQSCEVVVAGQLDRLQFPAHVVRAHPVEEVANAAMLAIGRAVDLACLALLVGLPHVADVQHSEHHPLGVTEGELRSGIERACGVGIDGQGDGDRPQGLIGQPHVGDHRVVLLLRHEAAQRGKAPGGEEFEVADLSVRQIPRWDLHGCLFELCRPRGIGRQIDQLPSMG